MCYFISRIPVCFVVTAACEVLQCSVDHIDEQSTMEVDRNLY